VGKKGKKPKPVPKVNKTALSFARGEEKRKRHAENKSNGFSPNRIKNKRIGADHAKPYSEETKEESQGHQGVQESNQGQEA